MTDIEITKACAEAMGYRVEEWDEQYGKGWWSHLPAQHGVWYDPLHDDAQAMAMVKKFGLNIEFFYWNDPKVIKIDAHGKIVSWAQNTYLNRAICECVAKVSKEPKP